MENWVSIPTDYFIHILRLSNQAFEKLLKLKGFWLISNNDQSAKSDVLLSKQ